MRTFKKFIFLADQELMQTGITTYSENMNTVVFSCINCEPTLIKQKTLSRQACTHENTCRKWLVHIFLYTLL